MLKIKSLSTKPKNPKLVKIINNSGIPRATIAQCLGISESWLVELINHKNMTKHDSATVKQLVNELSKKRGNK